MLAAESKTGTSKSSINHGFSIRENPYKYSSYYFDGESKFNYCQARYYSSDLMRFINRDTYDVSNRYAYCDDNPVEYFDPNGHVCERCGDTSVLGGLCDRCCRKHGRGSDKPIGKCKKRSRKEELPQRPLLTPQDASANFDTKTLTVRGGTPVVVKAGCVKAALLTYFTYHNEDINGMGELNEYLGTREITYESPCSRCNCLFYDTCMSCYRPLMRLLSRHGRPVCSLPKPYPKFSDWLKQHQNDQGGSLVSLENPDPNGPGHATFVTPDGKQSGWSCDKGVHKLIWEPVGGENNEYGNWLVTEATRHIQ
jgi:RHS repeat-associated protein